MQFEYKIDNNKFSNSRPDTIAGFFFGILPNGVAYER